MERDKVIDILHDSRVNHRLCPTCPFFCWLENQFYYSVKTIFIFDNHCCEPKPHCCMGIMATGMHFIWELRTKPFLHWKMVISLCFMDVRSEERRVGKEYSCGRASCQWI